MAKKKDAEKIPGPWVTVNLADVNTLPPALARIEIQSRPGAIWPRLPWYTHAYGSRVTVSRVNLPLIGREIELSEILCWRRVPW